MTAVVGCTLYEGHHVHGVPALINSLHRCGYRGLFVVGHRGPLPAWATGAAGDPARLEVDGIALVFVPLPQTDATVALYKPWLMREVLDRFAPQADGVAFLDADVVCVAPWRFFAEWIAHGVVVAEDYSFPKVPPGHPWRRAWSALARECGYTVRQRSDYFGSAFVGVPRAQRALVDAWWQLADALMRRHPRDAQRFQDANRMGNAFAGTDQDLLATAAMVTTVRVDPVGKELLGFDGAMHFLLHPTGPKSWRKSYIRDWLQRGRLPSAYDRVYECSLKRPLESKNRSRYWTVKIVRFLGRFYAARSV